MKLMTLTALGAAFLSLQAQANITASTSPRSFCSDRKDNNYFQDLLKIEENQLSFTNQGGLANGGVCWWHSRFTRNALYVAVYRPELRRPTVDQAEEIIKDIRKAKHVVTVPGFSNLREFSRAFRPQIQRELEKWQKGDGFIRQQWIVGLSGAREVEAEELKEKMDELYDYVVGEKNIAYQRLSMPGVVAHAWLVKDMHKTANGYDLMIHDSNYLGTTKWTYKEGMTKFDYSFYGKFVPYIERERELRGLKKVVRKFCD